MSILDALSRGWYTGMSAWPEYIGGGFGLLEDIIPGKQEGLERQENILKDAAQRVRDRGPEGESEGILEKIAEGLGAAPLDLTTYLPAGAAARVATKGVKYGRHLIEPALTFGLTSAIRSGGEGLGQSVGQGLRGAAEGAAFGGIGALTGRITGKAAGKLLEEQKRLYGLGTLEGKKAANALQSEIDSALNAGRVQAKRRAAHGVGAGSVPAAMTMLHGGDVEDAAASFGTMGILGALGGMSPRAIKEAGMYRDPFAATRMALNKLEPDAVMAGKARQENLAKEAERRSAEGEELPIGEMPKEGTAPASDFEAAGQRSRPEKKETEFFKEELRNYSQETIEKIKEFYGAKGEYIPRSDQDTARRAATEVFRDAEGKVQAKAEDIDALAHYMKDLQGHHQQKLRDLDISIEKANQQGNELEVQRLQEAKDAQLLQFTSDFGQFKGVRSVVGNALRVLRGTKRMTPDWIKHSESVKKNLGIEADRVIRMLEMSQDNPELMMKITKLVNEPRAWDYFQEYWINALLSGPPTHLVNISSNAYRQALDVVEKGAALRQMYKKGYYETVSDIDIIKKADVETIANSLEPGSRVRAMDRENYGQVVRVNKDGTANVHFVSPEGAETYVDLPLRQLVPTGQAKQRIVETTIAKKGIQRTEKKYLTKDQAVGEFKADLQAIFGAFKTANKAVKEGFRTEDFDVSTIDPNYGMLQRTGKIDEIYPKAIPGKLGSVIRTPGRMLQMMDIWFKIIAGERAAAAEAYRMGSERINRKEMTEADRAAYEAEVRGAESGKVDERILKAMKREAEKQTFTEPIPDWATPAQKIRQTEFLGTKPFVGILPFLSTPLNVIRQAVARSPLGYLRWKKLEADYKSGKLSPKEYYQEKAATHIGTIMTAGLVAVAKAGLITGGGPVNPQDRANKIATGWRPYSVHIPGVGYIQAQRLEPIGTILGMAGDIAEIGDSEDKMGKMMATIKDNITDKSFLYGIESLAKAWSNPEQFGTAYYKQMSGSLVPTLFAKAEQAVDPYSRQVDALGAKAGIPDAMAYRIPGLSKELPQRTTAFGEPQERWGVLGTDSAIEKAVGGAQSFIVPYGVSKEREGVEVEKEFDRLRTYPGMPPSMPKRSKRIVLQGVHGEKVELKQEEYDVFTQYHQQAKQQLEQIISSPSYASMPDPYKAKLLDSVYKKYRNAANKQINAMIRRRTTVGD